MKTPVRPAEFPPITNSPQKCFLCAGHLHKANRTAEHVFPEWLLHRYDLWDQLFTFPPKQTIHYRKIRIPCCRTCNNEHLGHLEQTVERAVRGGYSKFRRLHRIRIFQWLSKIIYEVMYMDARWFVDLKAPAIGTIRDQRDLERFRTLFTFLQSVRIPMRFETFKPWSVFIFEALANGDPRHDFDYIDIPELLTVAIRMGSVGVIAALQDNGAIAETYSPLQRRLRELGPVSPIQFREAAARVSYAASRINRTPKYITIYSRPTRIISMPLQGFSAKPIFDPADVSVFADFLSWFCQVPREECYSPENGLLTWLGPPPHN